MVLIQKILLSVPVILLLIFIVLIGYPSLFADLANSMTLYHIFRGIIGSLFILHLFILLKRLWSFENIPRKTKSDWTWYILLFGWVTILIYIWKKDAELEQLNNSSQ